IVVAIAHDLHFVLFPADHRFLEQHLARRRRFEAARDDLLELFPVVGDAAARTAERERRTDDGRKADLGLHRMRLFQTVRDSRTRRLETDLAHRVAKALAILRHVDGIAGSRNALYAVLLQHALAHEVERAAERRLHAPRRLPRPLPFLFAA